MDNCGLKLNFALFPPQQGDDNNAWYEQLLNNQIDIIVSYEIVNPIAGLRFLRSKLNLQTTAEFENFLYTEYYVGASYNWVPCIDQEVNFRFLTLIVPTDPIIKDDNSYDYQALSSGKLLEIQVDEQNRKKAFIFEISFFKGQQHDSIYQTQNGIQAQTLNQISLNQQDSTVQKNNIKTNLQQTINQNNNQQKYKLIKTDNIGFVVGRFQQTQIVIKEKNMEEKNNYLYCGLQPDQHVFQENRILQIYKQVVKSIEKHFYHDQPQEKSSKQVLQHQNGEKIVQINDHQRIRKFHNYKLVLLPNFQPDPSEDSLPYSFENLGIIDQNFLSPSLELTHDQKINQARHIFKTICMSKCQQFIKIGSKYHEDYWILPGINSFLADYFRNYMSYDQDRQEFEVYLYKQFERYYELVQRGQEISPLCSKRQTNEDQNLQQQQTNELGIGDSLQKGVNERGISNQYTETFGIEKFTDETYLLKARLVFHVLQSLTKGNGNIVDKILEKLERGKTLTTTELTQQIRKIHGIESIKIITNQFIKGTGVPCLHIQFQDQRRDTKINFTISQQAIQEEYFQFYNNTRFAIEDHLQYKSEFTQQWIKQRQKKGKQLSNLHQMKSMKPQSNSKEEANNITKANGDQQQNNNQSIIENIEDEEGVRFIVPEILHSIRLFNGRIALTIAETSENDYQEDQQHISLSNQQSENNQYIIYKSKFRKNCGRKGLDDEENKITGNSSQAEIQKLQELKKKDLSMRMWIKVNSDMDYFVISRIKSHSDQLMHKQIIKEKKTNVFMQILKNLRKHASLETIKVLRHLLEPKQWEEQMDSQMKQTLYTSLQMEILDTILYQISQIPSQVKASQLFFPVKMLQKIKCSEKENIVKPNDFSNYQLYMTSLHLIRSLAEIKDIKQGEDYTQSSQAIQILIMLLQENDNSMNQYDDSAYRALIIESLLKCNNQHHTEDILNEVLYQLDCEYLQKSYQNVMIRVILKSLNNFIQQNQIYQEGKQQSIEIKLINQIKQKINEITNYCFADICPINFLSNVEIGEKMGIDYYLENEKQLLHYMKSNCCPQNNSNLQKIHNNEIIQQKKSYNNQENNAKSCTLNILNKGFQQMEMEQDEFYMIQAKISDCGCKSLNKQIILVYKLLQFLDQVEEDFHFISNCYFEQLQLFYSQVLLRHREKYAKEMMLKIDIHNHHKLAQLIWNKLATNQVLLYHSKIRLCWIKIYIYFFYFMIPVSSLKLLKINEGSPISLFRLDMDWEKIQKKIDKNKANSNVKKYKYIMQKGRNEKSTRTLTIDIKNDLVRKFKGKIPLMTDVAKYILSYLKRISKDHEENISNNQQNNQEDEPKKDTIIKVPLPKDSLTTIKKKLCKANEYKELSQIRDEVLNVYGEYFKSNLIIQEEKNEYEDLVCNYFQVGEEFLNSQNHTHVKLFMQDIKSQN